MKLQHRFALTFLLLVYCTYGAEILGFFPIGGSSHYQPPEALLKALAARGHNVTVISSYPQKIPLKNFHDIDVSAVKGRARNTIPFKIVSTKLQNTFQNFNFITNISNTYCEIAFLHPEVQKLLTRERNFDLVITETFGSDCGVGFAWKYQAPLISILTSRRTPWASGRVGNPENPSYIPMMQMQFSVPMTFVERLINVFWYSYFTILYDYSSNTGLTDQISQKFFGPNVPPVNEIVYNTSLMLVNNHFSIDQSYPLVPNYIEIAGIHVKKPKPLPSDIQKFMDEAKQGVIYFTLGSLIRVSTLPNETIQAFKDAFAELPQRVLWKFELELKDIPQNVFISKWFPQNDIFAHQNLKLFITHGGNLGTIEAAHFGIPMVGISLYFDQYKNIQSYVDKGVAVRLGMNELTKQNIISAIKLVINDKGYNERMKKISQIFHDRPLSVIDTAVYWTEYVIRHKGAHHLKIAGFKMPWYQYYLLDVILFCLFVFCIVLMVAWRIVFIILCSVRNTYFSKKLKTV